MADKKEVGPVECNYLKDQAENEAREKKNIRIGGEVLLAMVLSVVANSQYKGLARDYLEGCPEETFVAEDGDSIVGKFNQEDTSNVPLLSRIKLKTAYKDWMVDRHGYDRKGRPYLEAEKKYTAPDIDQSSLDMRVQKAQRNR